MPIIAGTECDTTALRAIGQLLIEHFGHQYPTWTLEQAMSEIAAAGPVPATFVAMEFGEPLGCASLLDDDEVDGWDGHQWLGNVVVHPSARGRGIGAQLVDVVIDHARNLGLDGLWLVTDTAVDWYERRGWAVCGTSSVHGHPMTVMTLGLAR